MCSILIYSETKHCHISSIISIFLNDQNSEVETSSHSRKSSKYKSPLFCAQENQLMKNSAQGGTHSVIFKWSYAWNQLRTFLLKKIFCTSSVFTYHGYMLNLVAILFIKSQVAKASLVGFGARIAACHVFGL